MKHSHNPVEPIHLVCRLRELVNHLRKLTASPLAKPLEQQQGNGGRTPLAGRRFYYNRQSTPPAKTSFLVCSSYLRHLFLFFLLFLLSSLPAWQASPATEWGKAIGNRGAE